MIGGQVGIVGHLVIGNRVKIQAQTGVGRNLKDDEAIQGSPALGHAEYNKAYVIFKKLPMALSISPAAKAKLVERGMDFKYGARPLKRAIRKLVEDEIAERLLRGEFGRGDTIYVKKTADRLEFVKKGAKKAAAGAKPKKAKAVHAAQ